MLIVVTGANGLVGSRVCAVLSERGVDVRAIVRRAGSAPQLPGVTEWVGDFTDPEFARTTLPGADSAVTTVHPMGTDAATQQRVAVEGTPMFARAAASAGVARLVHISTGAVYSRTPEDGDVDESSPLVGDDADAYAITKRDTDLALSEVDGITRVLVRPPAILGPGPTSVWNTLRPDGMRTNEDERHAVPDQTWPWVHRDDLAVLVADLVDGHIATADDPNDPNTGPLDGGCTAVNVAGGPATLRDYFTTVTTAIGSEPVWEKRPAWMGGYRADRARAWGWTPTVDLTEGLAEIAAGLTPDGSS